MANSKRRIPGSFSELRNCYKSAEEFRLDFGALSFEEAHSLISAEQVSTHIKAAMMTFWRVAHQAGIEAEKNCCPDNLIKVSEDNEFLKNPYWKQYCDNAPSAALREVLYLQLEDEYLRFYKDDHYKDDHNEEISSRIKYLSGKLNKEDFMYLYENAKNGYARSYYRKIVELYE